MQIAIVRCIVALLRSLLPSLGLLKATEDFRPLVTIFSSSFDLFVYCLVEQSKRAAWNLLKLVRPLRNVWIIVATIQLHCRLLTIPDSQLFNLIETHL
jgi:hypothetical protein